MTQPTESNEQSITADAVIDTIIALAHADTARHIRERAILLHQVAQHQTYAKQMQEELAIAHAEISRLNASPPLAGETVIDGVIKDGRAQPAQA